jgi:hypothetical protein
MFLKLLDDLLHLMEHDRFKIRAVAGVVEI